MTQLAKTKQWLQSDTLRQQIQQALPSGREVNRFLRCLFTQVQVTPKLLTCSQESLYAAMIKCAQVGIEPDGRRAHLIPYGNQCQLILDYKGLSELAYRSGKIQHLHADVVRENDVFVHNKGTIETHTYALGQDRGEIIGAYALAKFDGGEKAEVLELADIEKVRKASKAGNSGPWKDHYSEMAKKTAFRRLSKWLPLSPEDKQAFEMDDDQFDRPEMKNVTPDITLPEVDESEVEAQEAEGGAQ